MFLPKVRVVHGNRVIVTWGNRADRSPGEGFDDDAQTDKLISDCAVWLLYATRAYNLS
jgi:hypothetical protein